MQLHCKQTHDEVYIEQAYKKTTLKQHQKSDFSLCVQTCSWLNPLENDATAIRTKQFIQWAQIKNKIQYLRNYLCI